MIASAIPSKTVEFHEFLWNTISKVFVCCISKESNVDYVVVLLFTVSYYLRKSLADDTIIIAFTVIASALV